MADSASRYPHSSIEDDFNYGSCVASASVHIRMAFLRKVYSIVFLQVLLTTMTAALFLYSESIQTFVRGSPVLIFVFAIGSLGFLIALTLNRHRHPLNLYLLFGFVGEVYRKCFYQEYDYTAHAVTSGFAFMVWSIRWLIKSRTLLEALSVAFAVTFYDVYIILQAFVLTTAVFLGLTVYTLQSKRDFSKFGAGLFAVLWILCLSGILKLFFYSETMELVVAAAGALLFCGFIIYDTHSLMHRLSPEEYVLAAINLYLDIINLFLHLLRFLEAVNKK